MVTSMGRPIVGGVGLIQARARPAIRPATVLKVSRIAALASAAMVLGFFGLVILFPGGTFVGAVVAAVTYLLLAGIIIGRLSPGAWMLSVLAAWGGILLAGLSLASGPAYGTAAVLVIASLGPSLLGGYIGRHMKRRLF